MNVANSLGRRQDPALNLHLTHVNAAISVRAAIAIAMPRYSITLRPSPSLP
jgi:hypothetical protein